MGQVMRGGSLGWGVLGVREGLRRGEGPGGGGPEGDSLGGEEGLTG